ncbi:hypothetical protein ACK6WG_19120, partial [Escherichia coli]
GPKTSIICSPMTSLKTSIKTITYLSDIGCLEIQGASLVKPLVSIDDYQTTDNKKEKNYCSPKPTFGLLRMFNKFSLI